MTTVVDDSEPLFVQMTAARAHAAKADSLAFPHRLRVTRLTAALMASVVTVHLWRVRRHPLAATVYVTAFIAVGALLVIVAPTAGTVIPAIGLIIGVSGLVAGPGRAWLLLHRHYRSLWTPGTVLESGFTRSAMLCRSGTTVWSLDYTRVAVATPFLGYVLLGTAPDRPPFPVPVALFPLRHIPVVLAAS